MPRKSKLQLPPLNLGTETLGQRIARLRKLQGYSQTELANKIGLTQDLISAYERGKLGMQAEMCVRFAKALKVSTDELLGVKIYKHEGLKPSLKLIRLMQNIQALSRTNRQIITSIIEIFIESNKTKSS